MEMEEKAEERDLKRMKFEAELEKRNMQERNHEERMQSMMMGYMTYMSMVSGRIPSPLPNSRQPSTSYIPYQHVPFDPQSQPYSPNNPFHDDI